MTFTDIPAEQTTAVTDAILAVMAVCAAVYLHRITKKDPFKTSLWIWLFCLLAGACLLGALVHGVVLPEPLAVLLWHPLYLALGLVIALFLVAMLHDVKGQNTARRSLPLMLAVCAGFFCTTLIWPDNFFVFLVYKSAAMLCALAGYLWLACKGRMQGARLMAAGIFTVIIGAVIQATSGVSITLIWTFDNNGQYHLILMMSIVLLTAGLRKGLPA